MLLKLDELLYTQKEVETEGVEIYTRLLDQRKILDPLHIKYCSHSNKYYMIDGHHRSYSMFYKRGINEITDDLNDENRQKFKLSECSEAIQGTESRSQCFTKGDPYSHIYTINELKLINYYTLEEETNDS